MSNISVANKELELFNKTLNSCEKQGFLLSFLQVYFNNMFRNFGRKLVGRARIKKCDRSWKNLSSLTLSKESYGFI